MDGGVKTASLSASFREIPPFVFIFWGAGKMSRVSWQRRLEEEEQVLEEVMRRSEWKVFAHSWEEADFTVESILV